MYSLLDIACKTLFLALPPALLVGRHLWPKKFTWPITVASAAILGWTILATYELFLEQIREHSERAYCEQIKLADPADALALDYPCRFVHYAYSYNYELGWLKALIWLIPWLCIYGLVQFIMRRRSQGGSSPPNTSLERTREG